MLKKEADKLKKKHPLANKTKRVTLKEGIKLDKGAFVTTDMLKQPKQNLVVDLVCLASFLFILILFMI